MSLEDRLLYLYREIRVGPESDAERHDPLDFEMVSAGDATGITLSGEERATWREILRLLYKGPWQEKLSEKYLRAKAAQLLGQAVNELRESKVRELVREMLDEFASYSTEQTVYLAIDGLKLAEQPELQLGNVLFRALTPESSAEILDSIPRAKSRGMFEAFLENVHESYARCPAVAVYRVVAEPRKARERAVEECRKALDLLWFGLPFLTNIPEHVGFGFDQDIARGMRFLLVVAPGGSATIETERAGPPASLTLGAKDLETLADRGVLKLSELHRKDKLSEVQRALLDAVRWLGEAQRQRAVPELRLLSSMTALESMFSRAKGQQQISRTIAEAAAFILGETLENRKAIVERLLELYGHRSAVSHGGRTDVSDTDLRWLWAVGANIVLRLVDRADLLTKSDLHGWLNDRRMEPGAPAAS